MLIQPYLFFEGRCEEAVNFYRQAVGAEVTMMMRYKESPDAPPPGMVAPGSEEKIMHCSFRIGDTTVMGSDGSCMQDTAKFQGFSLSLTVADEAQAKKCFDALVSGGEVCMPLGKTFFSPCFGMLTDRYGVSWMVIVMD